MFMSKWNGAVVWRKQGVWFTGQDDGDDVCRAFAPNVAGRVREERMSIRRGDVVSHCGAVQWGVGKVIEVGPYMVSIQFNDGCTRKIASSHFTSLLPAEPSLFIPTLPPVPKGATRAAPKQKKAPGRKQPLS